MVYVGSKARYADEILEIVLKDRKPKQLYIEPFMGGGNVICKVTGPRWMSFTDSIVYCDPPYYGTSDYQTPFDHKLFWSWVRNISRYNQVFISEYQAPKDFKCVWSKEVKSNLGNSSLNKVEKLFTLR